MSLEIHLAGYEAVEEAGREQGLEAGLALGVEADQVTGAGAARLERVGDRVGGLLRRDPFRRQLRDDLAEAGDRRPVELLLVGGGAAFDLLGVALPAFPDRGVDRARLDHRDRDAPGPQLLAEDVADRLDPELGGGVGPVEREGDAAADRGDEDDAAAGAA